jgi:pimeloyl-ACP methyl ester carboxylesterase
VSSSDSARFADIIYGGKVLKIEYAWISKDASAPLIVFLHEGLGSLRMWRNFPTRLCAATGCRGLLYSRSGYGESSPLWPTHAWPPHFMHIEATELLPRLMDALGIDTKSNPPILFGHSDGASIALIYASASPDRLAGLIVEAPHVLVEELTVTSIAAAKQKATETDLLTKLGKYHRNVDETFWGWANVWLSTEFRGWSIEALLGDLMCPALAIQGDQDEYGTMLQLELMKSAVPALQIQMLTGCGHSPHNTESSAVIAATTTFIESLALQFFGGRTH